MKVVLSVDPGKDTLKCIGKEIGTDKIKKIDFPSKYTITDDINEEYEGNSYMTVLNDVITIIGDAGKTYDFDSDKEKDLHKLCTYIAITRFLEPNTEDNEIYMVLACPLDFISRKESKDEYKKFIGNDGKEIKIKVDGKDYSFKIKDITAKQEGSGVIYKNIEKFKNKEVAVIDLGGVNFSLCIYDNCVAVKDSRLARDFGGNYLNNLTVNKLRGITKGKPITRQIALKSLIDGCLSLSNIRYNDSIDVIEKAKEEYFKTINDEIKKGGYDIDVVQPVFCGGTSRLIKDTISNKKPHSIIVDNPQWESVEGLFIVANSKYDKGDINE
ncbi:recombinase [Clostridium botulinum]|uniref:ParM/StbA family protein n=1 Tax=Clostridium botulinum TaxID=1491 RepID=UPI0007740C37|nr:ParM/StbA family protein [Clostridium botulinum]MBN3352661.1 recombinase [Clostridium botulinum]MBN3368336.1 recombinase [Clostridium botulinum]MBN3375908.1 recombinase [Clostridium botulinum]